LEWREYFNVLIFQEITWKKSFGFRNSLMLM
jgi:hypothetical protein